jgi:hypothetical protein
MEAESFGNLVLLLVPVIVVELGLMAVALVDLARRESVRFDNKLIWLAVIVLVNFIGPLVYFFVGRKED